MLIIGHRGAPSEAPENTIASFDAALAAGADMLEFDVRLTADGHPVVIHDARLLRTHHLSQAVVGLTLDQLRELTNEQPVPTLKEVLDRYFGRILLNIELKSRGSGVTSLRLLQKRFIKKKSDWDDVLISSFKARELLALRKISPEVNLSLLHDDNPFLFIAYARRLNLTAVGFHRLHLNRLALEIAKKTGLLTTVYTVNRPQAAKLLARQGYDAVFTNYPSRLIDELKQPLET